MKADHRFSIRVRRARNGRPARCVLTCPSCCSVLDIDLCRPARKPKTPAVDTRTMSIPGTETAEDVAAQQKWLDEKGKAP